MPMPMPGCHYLNDSIVNSQLLGTDWENMFVLSANMKVEMRSPSVHKG